MCAFIVHLHIQVVFVHDQNKAVKQVVNVMSDDRVLLSCDSAEFVRLVVLGS